MRIGSLETRSDVLLAPMAAVTDLPFRTICEEQGVGLTVTEFLSANALSQGAKKTVEKLQASLDGRAFGVQIFGRDEDLMMRAAEMAMGVGASLVDINMGCPAKRVVAGECGSALMREPELAARLVRAVRRAVPADVPVTVKHRAGWDERHLNAPEFACRMVDAGAAMITVHGRTRTQGFSGKASLDIIRKVREAVPREIPVVGNGDVVDVEGYTRMRRETGCDAVMIGRGAMGNPFLFARIAALAAGKIDPGPPTVADLRDACLRHLALTAAHTPERRQTEEHRKAATWYTRGLAGSAAFRQRVWSLDGPHVLEAAEEFFALAVERAQSTTQALTLRHPVGPNASPPGEASV
jgi:nifR3 family TIM-barrel protein